MPYRQLLLREHSHTRVQPVLLAPPPGDSKGAQHPAIGICPIVLVRRVPADRVNTCRRWFDEGEVCLDDARLGVSANKVVKPHENRGHVGRHLQRMSRGRKVGARNGVARRTCAVSSWSQRLCCGAGESETMRSIRVRPAERLHHWFAPVALDGIDSLDHDEEKGSADALGEEAEEVGAALTSLEIVQREGGDDEVGLPLIPISNLPV